MYSPCSYKSSSTAPTATKGTKTEFLLHPAFPRQAPGAAPELDEDSGFDSEEALTDSDESLEDLLADADCTDVSVVHPLCDPVNPHWLYDAVVSVCDVAFVSEEAFSTLAEVSIKRAEVWPALVVPVVAEPSLCVVVAVIALVLALVPSDALVEVVWPLLSKPPKFMATAEWARSSTNARETYDTMR